MALSDHLSLVHEFLTDSCSARKVHEMMREVNHKMKPVKRFWSKRPMVHTTFRIPEEERELWRAASMKAGVSLNDFVREAIKEKSASLLARRERGNATGIEA